MAATSAVVTREPKRGVCAMRAGTFMGRILILRRPADYRPYVPGIAQGMGLSSGAELPARRHPLVRGCDLELAHASRPVRTPEPVALGELDAELGERSGLLLGPPCARRFA